MDTVKPEVIPSGTVLFEQPVADQTSELTVNAGEVFTDAMAELPQVRAVGPARKRSIPPETVSSIVWSRFGNSPLNDCP